MNIYTTKKEFYKIPYWDRLRIGQMKPQYESGSYHLNVRPIDRTHYILTQVVVENDDVPLKYEMLKVTIHGYVDSRHYHYKSYTPLKVVWFA